MAYKNFTAIATGDASEMYTVSGANITYPSSSPSPPSGFTYCIGAGASSLWQFGPLDASGAQVTNSDIGAAYVSFYLQISGTPANTMRFRCCDKFGSTIIDLTIDSSRNLGLVGATSSSTTTLTASTWYLIELQNVGNGTTATLKVNGSTIGTATCQSPGNGFGYLSCNSFGFATTRYVTGIVIADAAFTYPSFGVLKPRAAGNASAWTGGTGSTFAEVDEIPPDSDTTYLKDSTSGNASSFAMESTTTGGFSGKTVYAVKTLAVVRDEGGGSESVKVRCRNGSTNNDTTGADPGSSYVGLARIDATDPNTGSAWATSGIDTAEAGVVNNASVAVRCTLLMFTVIYQAQINITGTIASSFPKLTAALSVKQKHKGTITASFPKMTAALAAKQKHVAAIAASFIHIGAVVQVKQKRVATIASSFTKMAAALVGRHQHAGSIIGNFTHLGAVLSAFEHPRGAIAAALPRMTAALAVTQKHVGAIASSLPRMTAAIAIAQKYPTAIGASFPMLGAALVGAQKYPTAIAASFPRMAAALAVTQKHSAAIASSFPRMTAAIAVKLAFGTTISASFPRMTAAIQGHMDATGTMASNFGRMTAAIAGMFVNLTGAGPRPRRGFSTMISPRAGVSMMAKPVQGVARFFRPRQGGSR